VADIFIRHTDSDREWAFWNAGELKALGHIPHVLCGDGNVARELVVSRSR